MRLSHVRPLGRGAAVALATAALVLAPITAHAADSPTTTTTGPAPATTTGPAPTTTTTPPGSGPTTTTSTSSTSSTTAGSSETPGGTTSSGSSTTGNSTTSPTTSPSTSTPAAHTTSPSAKTVSAKAKAKGGVVAFATPKLAAQSVAGISPAADFLATTLAARGDHYDYPPVPGFPPFLDGGNTVDAALGLDAAGEGLNEADNATAYLEGHVGEYIGTGGTLYAGNVAKTLILADAQGADPTSFGGVDLVTSLQGLETPSGQFKDKPDDYSNSIGQSLSIIALGRAGAAVSTTSVDFLLAQQCADGGIRTFIGVTPCVSDIDTTAFAIQALVGAKGSLDPAVVKALGWLAGKQAANGGFLSSDGIPSSNSTAVAAQAFAAAGDDTRLARAQGFLATLQYGCSFPAALRGGIAKSPADYAAAKAKGATATVADGDLRATPQSTMALAGGSLLTVAAGDGVGDTTPLQCAPTSTTTNSTTSPPRSTTTTTTTTHAGAVGTTTSPISTATGQLAYTGAEIWPLALIAVLLLLLGSGAVVASRRRVGAHA